METWQKELAQCVRTVEQLKQHVHLENHEAIRQAMRTMRLSITPHTLKLINFNDPADPLLLMSVPQERELTVTPEELRDPIGNETKSPVPFLTHRYPDRVLVYATFSCAHYCRFCFRRFKTGVATPGPSEIDWDRIVEYLRSHGEVDEVILTGGDPWTLLDDQLEVILKRLRSINSITRIRFHTRVLVNLPSRVTLSLVETLRRYMDTSHPIYVVTHFNHPREMAPENVVAVARLVDAGIVVRNQSVLLASVNDDEKTLRVLFKKLVNIRVVPYYLHQLDLAKGTHHFRVPIERGIELMRRLQGHLTGLAIPRFMLDIPSGKGKVPLSHVYHEKNDHGLYSIETIDGDKTHYREPEIN